MRTQEPGWIFPTGYIFVENVIYLSPSTKDYGAGKGAHSAVPRMLWAKGPLTPQHQSVGKSYTLHTAALGRLNGPPHLRLNSFYFHPPLLTTGP